MSDTDKTRPYAVRAQDSLESRKAHHRHLDFGKPVYEFDDLLDADGEPVTWRNAYQYRDENGDGVGMWRVEWFHGEVSWHEVGDLDWFLAHRRQVREWKFALAPGYALPFYGYPQLHPNGYRTFNPDGYDTKRFNLPLRVRRLVGHVLDYCTTRYEVPAGTPDRFIPCSWWLAFDGPHRCSGYRPEQRRPQNRARLAATTKLYNAVLSAGGWDEEGDGDGEGLWDEWKDELETYPTVHSGWWCC